MTDNYFGMLEILPLTGRTIDSEDELADAPVAMIGETLWRRRARLIASQVKDGSPDDPVTFV